MNKALLVADSGGTQTDWCFVNESGSRTFFTTSSFHPSNWNDQFYEEFLAFWSDKNEIKAAQLHFYGAGCLQESNQQKITDYFHQWGFNDVQVFSDILGACHASLGNEKGNVAILGTGSVFCKYDGEKITSIHGGLGYLLGDEGSGYYFGKMLLRELLNNKFDVNTTNKLTELLGTRNEILNKVYGKDSKAFIGSIAGLLNELNQTNKHIENLHTININKFVDFTVLPNCDKNEIVSFIGSYSFFNKYLVIDILHKNNLNLKNVHRNPINSLTDYIQKATL